LEKIVFRRWNFIFSFRWSSY